MNPIKQLAYYIVFKDLTKTRGLFTGTYDARHGDPNFMYGLAMPMEFIAYCVSDKVGEKFAFDFTENMLASQEKAEREERK